MKKRKTILLTGISILSLCAIISAYAAVDTCNNQGFGVGWSWCQNVDYCSNHGSPTTCTTAKCNWQIATVTSMPGYYVDYYEDVCTQDVTCEYDVNECVIASYGDTHNALFPYESSCY